MFLHSATEGNGVCVRNEKWSNMTFKCNTSQIQRSIALIYSYYCPQWASGQANAVSFWDVNTHRSRSLLYFTTINTVSATASPKLIILIHLLAAGFGAQQTSHLNLGRINNITSWLTCSHLVFNTTDHDACWLVNLMQTVVVGGARSP